MLQVRRMASTLCGCDARTSRDEDGVAIAKADAGDGGVEIKRAAIVGCLAGLIEGKLQFRQRQVGAEVFRVAGQVFVAELLELLVLAVEEELTHLVQMRESFGIHFARCRCTRPCGGFGECDAFRLRCRRKPCRQGSRCRWATPAAIARRAGCTRARRVRPEFARAELVGR